MTAPLSPQQRSIWLQARRAGADGLFNVPSLFSITGGLDCERLREALRLVVSGHEMLRARFVEIEGRPVQSIADAPPLDFELVEAGGAEPDLDAIAPLIAAPLDLEAGVPIRFRLLRLGGQRHIFLVVAHHLVWDSGSEAIFLSDLARAYGGEPIARQGEASLSYFEIGRRLDLKLGEARARPGDSLAAELAGLPAPDFTFPPRREGVDPYGAVFARARLGAARAAGVQRLAKAAKVTPYILLLCMFRVLVARQGRLEDFLVATPMSLRTRPGSLATIGYLTNVTAVRNPVVPEHCFSRVLQSEKAAVLSAMRRSELPLSELFAGHADTALAPAAISFSYSRADQSRWALGPASCAPMALTGGIAQFDLAADIVADGSGMDLLIVGRAAIFEQAEAERLALRFVRLLDQVVERPDIAVEAIDAMTGEDRATLGLVESRQRPEPRSAVQMFLDWAERAPAAPAVRHGEACLTYAELADSAFGLADALRRHRLPAESPVALLMERSAQLPAALLGIALAGHSVVPLDPEQPAGRLDAVIRHCGAMSVVVGAADPPLDLEARIVVRLDGRPAPSPDHAARIPPAPRSLAYILYTSGSTGGPKGVAIEHASVANCLAAARELIGYRAGQSLLSSTTIAFDIAALEILLPLVSGGTLILSDRDMRDGYHVRALMERHRPDYFQGTPAVWKLLFAAGWEGQEDLVGLIGGDVVPPSLAARILSCTRRLWHTYGPTETTLFTIAEEILDTGASILPVGTPLHGTCAYVLDSKLDRCLPGTVGELFIAGAGLARFYLRMPRQTASAFLPDPFAPVPGERMYRTGDLARLRLDGRIEILGRTDRQVKIRGFRIEPGEVERILCGIEGIADCAAIVVDRGSDRARLVACIEAAPGYAQAETVEAAARDHLARLLPAYMRPSLFLVYETLPLGPTGKVDRSRLMRDALAVPMPGDAPRTEDALELAVARAWTEALGGVQCGPGSDFTGLGGSSISATIASAMICQALGVRVDPITFLMKPLFEDFMGEVRRELGRERFYAAVRDGSTCGKGVADGILAEHLHSEGNSRHGSGI